MGVVSLEGLEFFAYHGYYDEEQKIGNRYQVDVHITTRLDTAGRTDLLEDTVNYGRVYEIVSEVMSVPARLLEHIAASVIGRLRSEFPFVEKVMVKVIKMNPPIGGLCRRASISLEG